MTKLEADVAIVGGGPAGLCAAHATAEGGLETVVLEKSREIGYPLHTSGATLIEEIKALGIPDSYIHPITKVSFFSNRNKAVFETDAKSVGVLDVRGAYQYLARRAVGAGASILVGTSAKQVILEGDRVVGVRARRADGEVEVRARVSIDASGISAVLARSAGLRTAIRRFAIGVELDLFAPAWDQQEFTLIVGSEIAPTGYGWIFPWGSGRVRAGIGVTRPDSKADPMPYLRRMVEEDPRFAPSLTPHGEIELHRGLFPSEGILDRPACDGLLVIGDAAGHSSLLVGEGIRFCMQAGQTAGEGVAVVLKKGEPTAGALAAALKPWNKRHARNFTLAHEANTRMTGFSDNTWDETLSAMAKLSTRQFLQFLTTDFTLPLMAGMLAKNPALLKGKTFKKILRGVS